MDYVLFILLTVFLIDNYENGFRYMFKFKICLAGAKNVGKSSLIARYCDDLFNENMMDTNKIKEDIKINS